MNIAFVDLAESRTKLLPLTFTRPISDLRIGIYKIYEKWLNTLEGEYSFITDHYLSKKYKSPNTDDLLCINGGLCPSSSITESVMELRPNQALMNGDTFLAARVSHTPQYGDEFWKELDQVDFQHDLLIVERPWDIFMNNSHQILADMEFAVQNGEDKPLTDPNIIVYGEEKLFIDQSADVKACVIDVESGPVYIGKNCQIAPGAIIQGPVAICDHAQVKMGGRIRGGTTIGPHCRAGGEISNVVFQGFSNKAHDGFLGNAVLGEWCNLGADTNNSNLKNNYTNVKVWDYSSSRFTDTGLQFCGLIMGDHSKCGINTMFNTGTVVGVGANIFGPGFPRNFIPSFSWGGSGGFATFGIKRALETARIVMDRRGLELNDVEEEILHYVFNVSKEHRIWEKTKTS